MCRGVSIQYSCDSINVSSIVIAFPYSVIAKRDSVNSSFWFCDIFEVEAFCYVIFIHFPKFETNNQTCTFSWRCWCDAIELILWGEDKISYWNTLANFQQQSAFSFLMYLDPGDPAEKEVLLAKTFYIHISLEQTYETVRAGYSSLVYLNVRCEHVSALYWGSGKPLLYCQC